MTVIAHIKNIIIEVLFCIPIVLVIEFAYDKIEERQNKKLVKKMDKGDKGENERKK